MSPEKLIVSTKGAGVTSNRGPVDELSSIQPCSHEEADTRIILHLTAASYKAAMIRTVDTDVVVLAVAYCLPDRQLWVAFGACSRNCEVAWTSGVTVLAHVPCPHWLRHSLLVPHYWEEEGLAGLGSVP